MPASVFDTHALHLSPVQRAAEAAGLGVEDPDRVHAHAARGVSGPATALPHGDVIQRAFGPDHDLSNVQAHVGGPAADASEAIGATAYATGNHIAFAKAPDLHTAAHEAAHHIQQRAGVSLKGGVGQSGDPYEQHADAVADRVVRGESAADLLASGPRGGSTTSAIQRFGAEEHRNIGNAATGGTVDKSRPKDNYVGTNETHGAQMIPLAPDYALPHGEIIALAGDHFESIDQMRLFARKKRGPESRAEIEYARYWKLHIQTSKGKFDAAAQAAQEKRYYTLALNNRRHFSNPAVGDADKSTAERMRDAPDPANDPTYLLPGAEFHAPPNLDSALHAYRYYHLRALATAVKAGAATRAVASTTNGVKVSLGDAFAEEAFGHHFLTDSFSAGHVRTERASVQEYWNKRYPMFNYNLKGFMAEGISRILARVPKLGLVGLQVREDTVYDPPFVDGALATVTKTLDKSGTLGFGDVMSGMLHDHDNEKGIRATTDDHDALLHGDGHLNEGDTMNAVKLAVKAGLEEVKRAFGAGAMGTEAREAIAALRGPDQLFAPERMIFATEQRTTIEGATKDLKADQKAALKESFLTPLETNPVAVLRQVLDWTPSISDSPFGHKTDDRARDYWQEAKRTPGGLPSLTYVQRENLIARLLDGPTVGEDEDAIMDLLRTAPTSDVRRLIARFGWKTLRSEIDDGFGEEFADEFSSPLY